MKVPVPKSSFSDVPMPSHVHAILSDLAESSSRISGSCSLMLCQAPRSFLSTRDVNEIGELKMKLHCDMTLA